MRYTLSLKASGRMDGNTNNTHTFAQETIAHCKQRHAVKIEQNECENIRQGLTSTAAIIVK